MKYYDHDKVWSDRKARDFPYWGPYSEYLYIHLLKWLNLGKVGAGQRVLDVGCGAGAFGKLLHENGMQYVGIDDSQVAIHLGRNKFPSLSLHCMDFTQNLNLHYNQEEPPNSNCLVPKFDAVTCINVLHCFTEKEHRHQCLSNIAAVLKPGGILLLTTMCLPTLEGFSRSKNPRAILSPDAIKQELKECGLLATILKEEFQPAEGKNKIANLSLLTIRQTS